MTRMNFKSSRMMMVPFLMAVASAGFACDVDKTQEGKMPEVEVTEGQMPEYDVDGPDVEVKTETKEVEVPDVDVHTEKKTVEVPDIDVDMPNDGE